MDLEHIDVGGGLAIDYDGSQTNFHSSMDYSMQEYANDVVSVLQDICDELEQPHPHIISESGRALVAHQRSANFRKTYWVRMNLALKMKFALINPVNSDSSILHTMFEADESVSLKNAQECFNDAVTAKDEGIALFSHGVIDLESRACIDEIFGRPVKKY